MEKHKTTLAGGCLCGAVRYEANHEPLAMGYCHCRSCQRSTGAGYIAWVCFPEDHLQISGEYKEYESVGDSGKTVHRGFCPECGSRLFFRGEVMPGLKNISATSLDDPSIFKPTIHLWMEHAQPWDRIEDHCVKFDRNPE
jgi:hypothetical protein